jgi:hypothetical protein
MALELYEERSNRCEPVRELLEMWGAPTVHSSRLNHWLRQTSALTLKQVLGAWQLRSLNLLLRRYRLMFRRAGIGRVRRSGGAEETNSQLEWKRGLRTKVPLTVVR